MLVDEFGHRIQMDEKPRLLGPYIDNLAMPTTSAVSANPNYKRMMLRHLGSLQNITAIPLLYGTAVMGKLAWGYRAVSRAKCIGNQAICN